MTLNAPNVANQMAEVRIVSPPIPTHIGTIASTRLGKVPVEVKDAGPIMVTDADSGDTRFTTLVVPAQTTKEDLVRVLGTFGTIKILY